MTGEKILVVDDDPAAAAYAALALEQAGYRVETANDGIRALLSMQREAPALVVSDLDMPEMNGLEFVEHARGPWPHVPIIVLSVAGETSAVVEAVSRGAVNYLVKPAAPAALRAAAARALLHAVRPHSPSPAPLIEDMVGVSAAIVRARHTIELAARSDVNVIVVGETGAGKELVARALHRLSGCEGPFVAHNCATTPPELFDSELFGHQRGAFTGADRERAGLLRRADGGVLFLDELECLPLANQAKLLRVLDDGEVRPIGSEQARPVSVRFVAATNCPPDEMITGKELRADLYYRLRGFEIEVPPLRERREDLPHLARHFLRDDDPGTTPAALDALARHEWPGNVRELRNVLRSARARAAGRPIDVQHLELAAGGRPALSSSRPPTSDTLPAKRLDEVERDVIARTLAEQGHNLSRAALALGIHRSTLRRKLAQLGLRNEALLRSKKS